jgi:hypothetical protein
MAAEIIHLVRQFDPLSADAEERYDRVAHRINQLSVARVQCQRSLDEVERQFVENDLTSTRGEEKGSPLSAEGRRRRLWHFVCLNQRLDAISSERERLTSELDCMNTALDSWAQEAYGTRVAHHTGSAPFDDPAPKTDA